MERTKAIVLLHQVTLLSPETQVVEARLGIRRPLDGRMDAILWCIIRHNFSLTGAMTARNLCPPKTTTWRDGEVVEEKQPTVFLIPTDVDLKTVQSGCTVRREPRCHRTGNQLDRLGGVGWSVCLTSATCEVL